MTYISPEVKKRQAIERRIAKQAIEELIAAGFSITVDNGGEDGDEPIKQSRSVNAILKEMFAVDDERLYVHNAENGVVVGWLYFVYGNDGWDVLNDNTTNLEPHLTKTNALIEKLGEC